MLVDLLVELTPEELELSRELSELPMKNSANFSIFKMLQLLALRYFWNDILVEF